MGQLQAPAEGFGLQQKDFYAFVSIVFGIIDVQY